MTSIKDKRIFNDFISSVEKGHLFTTHDVVEYALNRRLRAPLRGTISRLIIGDDRVIKVKDGQGYGAPPVFMVIA